MPKKGKRKQHSYQVCVTILEARHLPQDGSPLVVVKVGDRRKKTAIREKTDCPVYNEYFVFNFTTDLDALLTTRIEISVYVRNRFRRLKYHGSSRFEVATVWDQPDHQYYRKWALLTDPKEPAGGSKGYVKCNITINVKGERVRVHPETDGEEDIEANLLLPLGGESYHYKQRASYIFTVYRADGLPDMSSFCVKANTQKINPYVQISFAGMKGSTEEEWHTYAPIFDEKIIFKELFPPYSRRIRISVKHRIDSCRSCTVASHVIHMSDISNSGEHGFPPIYGPSFIHLYGCSETVRKGCKGKPVYPGLPPYRGRVLLSLRTEMDDPEASPRAGVENIPTFSIVESTLWKTEEYLLVCVIYDVCMIDRRRFANSTLSFEIGMGNVGNRQFSRSRCVERDEELSAEDALLRLPIEYQSYTAPRTTGTLDSKYNYLPLGSRKPCMFVKSRWPNLDWRIRNSNHLRFISKFLEGELEKLELMIAVENPQAYKAYNETIRSLKEYCERYLRTFKVGRYQAQGATTKLDRQRINVCGNQIEDTIKRIEVNGELPNNHYLKIAMTHAYQYLGGLQDLRDDPQQSLPDIFLWMIAGGKRVAYTRLSAESIIYFENEHERGIECGDCANVFMSGSRDETEPFDYSPCKVDAFFWLGSSKYNNACWSAILPGYDVDHRATDLDTFPRFFEYTVSSSYQLRAHIFQGRFDPGMDESGMLDAEVRVTFYGHTLTTRVIRQSLDPFWDQTLVFPPVTLYGTRESMKRHPPKVLFQVFDQDFCGIKEFCGRCIAVPLVKLTSETYSPPDFPPKLEWYKFKSQRDCTGWVLAVFELIELGDTTEKPLIESSKNTIYNIPPDIRPRMAKFRMEVMFWGMRDMRKIGYIPVRRPRIVVECEGVHIKSYVMENAKKFCNFGQPHVMVELEMPEVDIYYPCVTIKAYDSRGFGCFKFVGVYIVPTIHAFLEQLITERDYQRAIFEDEPTDAPDVDKASTILKLPKDHDVRKKTETEGLIAYSRMGAGDAPEKGFFFEFIKSFYAIFTGRKEWRKTSRRGDRQKRRRKRREESKAHEESGYEDEDKEQHHDWWSKYFASLEEERNRELGIVSLARNRRETFKIYSSELEMQPMFRGFQDRLKTFELWRGKRTGNADESSDAGGKFKGNICVYRWPHPQNLPCKTPSGRSAAVGLFDDYPPQEPIKFLARVYVVKGINLQPKDPLSGKSDPYLYVMLGKKCISDRKNYVPNQLNPTFGRLFEFDATFPQDYLLTIQVWDYDATTSDDLIGVTKIDLENRFYSSHRGNCGLSKTYNANGYIAWRDCERPTQILDFLCRKNNLPAAEYLDDCVRIGKRKFPVSRVISALRPETMPQDREDRMALSVLHRWQDFPICGCVLVPEHVERRPLFNSKRPGLEQGRLELWIDMFQFGQLPLKPPVDIAPYPPEEYEIRVIVWNTEDVPLVDSQFLTGEKCSDIYVKGWILYEDYQKTDIHYNSLTGEGNFNWRFVFRIMYARGERVMIVRKKMSVFARNEIEEKLPCRLHLQVWDSDHFSHDDFLGALTLDLAKLVRGSSNSKTCTLSLMDLRLPTINLFKITRTKGWWPFMRRKEDGTTVQAGKIEMELSAVRASEANQRPAGKGREPPESLSLPNRPETSFSWFKNPWKACRHVLCRYYKWRIIGCFLCLLLILLVGVGIYAFPKYLVKRVIGA